MTTSPTAQDTTDRRRPDGRPAGIVVGRRGRTGARATWLRTVLGAAAAGELVVGVWAQFAPRSFYDDFPGGGRAWVAADGPFNEHLVRDVGALNLALAAITAMAAVTLATTLVRAVAAGSILYDLPHLVHHVRHLEPFDPADAVANVVALGLNLALAVVALLLVSTGGDAADEPEPAPARSRSGRGGR